MTEARLQNQGNVEASGTTHSNEGQHSRIAVPSRLSDVTMHEIRTHWATINLHGALFGCAINCFFLLPANPPPGVCSGLPPRSSTELER